MNELHLGIRKRRGGLISAGIILHHDNFLTHTSHLVSSTIYNLKYKLLHHLSYSPDLVSSNYFLFPNLKDYLKERHYNDRSSLGSSIHHCLNSMFEDDFATVIQ